MMQSEESKNTVHEMERMHEIIDDQQKKLIETKDRFEEELFIIGNRGFG